MKTGRFYLFLFFCLTLFTRLNATHNRAGEITYMRIAPFTTVVAGIEVNYFKYRITIITYTDDGPSIADRCVDTVYFGDGERGIAKRINGSTTNCCSNNQSCCGILCGELIINETNPLYKVKKNIYTVEHVYPGAGAYLIRSLDPNRNSGVYNIPNSVNQPFYLESYLIINSFTGANSSPVLNNAPVDRACVTQCFYHNPGAYDADGDSLSFELSASRGANGQTVTGYSQPSPGSGGSFSINPVTGLLTWCTPQAMGEYNIAFLVKEWRKNTNRIYQLIGYVLRDMQVIVASCPNEFPPTIVLPQDTCVEAGTNIYKSIIVKDPNTGGYVTLEGSGGAFSANSPQASLSNTTGPTGPNSDLVAKFSWLTSCNHIRQQPYLTTFKAQDNGTIVKQVSFATYSIKIIPPSIKGVTATPSGSSMKISWILSTCNPTNNPIVGYRIYRKNDCTPYVQEPCTTIIPASSGFILIGQTNAKAFTFTDTNGGDGLVVGQSYSYLVIAIYADGTQTYGTSQVCATLKRDIPIILNVDVLSTSVSTGSIKVVWTRPLTNKGNLDTTVYKAPYQFNLKHTNSAGVLETVFTTTNNVLAKLDTFFYHQNVNTTLRSEEYIVEFLSGSVTVGNSQKASSVFLSTTPSDRRIDLSWAAKTPWNNYTYTIKRKDPGTSTYTTIATTSLQTYTDKNNIANRNTYCYQVVSEGAYSDVSIAKPLINNSQESCAFARDLTPPCSPTLTIDADCPVGFVKVNWNDVKTICDRSDDVTKYNLYYKPTVSDEYNLITTISENSVREYTAALTLISGCYAIQSVDSAGNVSPFSADFCIDNCPIFELPNIFTPNGDNVNDFFKAIRVRQIKEIDMTVYDRWGNLVYRTKDPYFNWDGKSIFSKELVSEGTFFYICDVYEPRLRGIIKRTLKGYVEVVR